MTIRQRPDAPGRTACRTVPTPTPATRSARSALGVTGVSGRWPGTATPVVSIRRWVTPTTMTTSPRYRSEHGRSCIDLNIRHSRQLFDSRDPAPFRERDLDDAAVAYLLSAAQEIPRKHPLAIVVTISEEPLPRLPADVIVAAMRGHFVYEGEQVERRLREHLRRGQLTLGVGLTVLVVFLTLAQLTASQTPGPLREILREGLVITGWVAMWRPLEILLYDWWPLVDERRHIRRILEAPVSIRYHEPSIPAAGASVAPDPAGRAVTPDPRASG